MGLLARASNIPPASGGDSNDSVDAGPARAQVPLQDRLRSNREAIVMARLGGDSNAPKYVRTGKWDASCLVRSAGVGVCLMRSPGPVVKV